MAKQESDRAEMRRRLIAEALPIVMHEGWTQASLARAAQEADIPPAQLPLLFPRGAAEAACYFCSMGDEALSARVSAARKKEKIHERIGFLLMERLKNDAPHKEAARRAYLCLALPFHSPFGMRAILSTSDALWRAAGDSSTDFSHYTKRIILAGVYLETLLIWFGRMGDDESYVEGFAMRRLKNVTALGKSLRSLPSASGLMEEILKNLARLRYPERG